MRTATDHESRKGLSLVSDVLLMSVIGIAPLLMGGRHPAGKLAYVALVAALSVVWVAHSWLARRTRFRLSGVELILLAAVLLVTLQLIPLPESWIASVSPHIGRTLPLWSSSGTSAASLGPWTYLSLTPESTRGGFAILLAHGMLFVVLLQRLNTIDDIERQLRWIAIAVVGMATLGLVQYLFGNGRFLWVYDHPSRDTFYAVKGTFANANHFAHYLALGLGPLVWWLTRSWGESRSRPTTDTFATASTGKREQALRVTLAFSLGVTVFAGLLSYSRGGLIVMFVVLVTCVAIYAWRSLLDRRSCYVLAVAASVVGLAICVHGVESISAQIRTLTQGSIDSLDREEGRRRIWAANLAAISHYPIVGTGIGSHREVYPTYFEHATEVEYTHAENGYLQVLLESGAPGLSLLLIGIALCGSWCVRGLRYSQSKRIAACLGAVTGGLVASVTHSLVDFVWYLPACMAMAIVLAACACRLFQISREREFKRRSSVTVPRGVWLAAGTATAVLSVVIIRISIGPALGAVYWDQYLAKSLSSKPQLLLSESGGDDSGQDETAMQTALSMKRNLESALRYNPNDARANLRFAAICLRLFDHVQLRSENAMRLSQIRDAAVASNFESRQDQDQWLAAAIGDNRDHLDQALAHTRRALQLCPLQGEGYVYLSELAFLEGYRKEAQSEYMSQALRVRPHHGAILFAAGREAALSGQIDLALDFWKRAFHQDRELQKEIVAALTSQLPASFVIAKLEPDIDAMALIFQHYMDTHRNDQATIAGQSFVAMLERTADEESGAQSAERWRQAYTVHRFLGNHKRATICLRKAVNEAPNDFALRHTLAVALYEQEQYDLAYEQLQWCTRRRPDDDGIRRRIRDVRARLSPRATHTASNTQRRATSRR